MTPLDDADPTMRVLVVDDDPLARARIVETLAAEPAVQIVGECGDGPSAVEGVLAWAPDLVLLDVQMPGFDGFEVVQRVGAARMPAVVFTSAYAEYAVRAFEAYAIDYVLKPFDDARLLAAVARVRARHLGQRRAPAAPPAPRVREDEAPDAEGGTAGRSGPAPAPADVRLRALLDHLNLPARPRYPDALAVRASSGYAVVRIVEISWFEAEGNYARIHGGGRARLVSKSLATLEREVLDPERFVRVHRSAIVNVATIHSVEPLFHGDLLLVLADGARVTCSRRYRARLEERLYFTT